MRKRRDRHYCGLCGSQTKLSDKWHCPRCKRKTNLIYRNVGPGPLPETKG